MMVEALRGPRKPGIDRLTGVMNRRALDEAGRALSDSSDPRPLVVASGDVDGLKRINDTRGHAVGDQVLQWVGYRLFVTVGAAGLVARAGGDEFVALLPDVGLSEVRLLPSTALAAIRMPTNGLDLPISIACGVASASTATDWQNVWRRADEALYIAKRSGPGGISFSEGG